MPPNQLVIEHIKCSQIPYVHFIDAESHRQTTMCTNDLYECQKVNASYVVILPTTYAPLNLPTTESPQERQAVSSSSSTSKTVSIPIPTEVHRAFPEIGSFGSYGKAGLAC